MGLEDDLIFRICYVAEWFKQVGPICYPKENEIAAGSNGTITAAWVPAPDGSTGPFVVLVSSADYLCLHYSSGSPGK